LTQTIEPKDSFILPNKKRIQKRWLQLYW